MYNLTIDGGTTNTRITLWYRRNPILKKSFGIGVKNTVIDGNNTELKTNLNKAINNILVECNLLLKEISYILASGMITSNLGLVEIPHLTVPVGIKELTDGMVEKHFPDIVDKEIWFIPGVKNDNLNGFNGEYEQLDMMRGEETETIGLMVNNKLNGPALIVLPGSHTKFVSINKDGKITGCLTTLAGELLQVITNYTIISESLENMLAKHFNKDYITMGYRNGKKFGITRSCFTTRILDQFTNLTQEEKANFLLGAIISDDLKAIKNSAAIQINANSNVYIAGKDILRKAYYLGFIEEQYFNNVVEISNSSLDFAGLGAISQMGYRHRQ